MPYPLIASKRFPPEEVHDEWFKSYRGLYKSNYKWKWLGFWYIIENILADMLPKEWCTYFISKPEEGKAIRTIYVPLSNAENLVDVPRRINNRKKNLSEHAFGDNDGLSKHIFNGGTNIVLTRMLGRMYYYVYMNELRFYKRIYQGVLSSKICHAYDKQQKDDDIPDICRFEASIECENKAEVEMKILLYLQMMRCASHIKFAIKAMPEWDAEHWDGDDDIEKHVHDSLLSLYREHYDGNEVYMKDMMSNRAEWKKESIGDEKLETYGVSLKSAEYQTSLEELYYHYFNQQGIR
jgi:hypothetical protein